MQRDCVVYGMGRARAYRPGGRAWGLACERRRVAAVAAVVAAVAAVVAAVAAVVAVAAATAGQRHP